VKTTNMKETLSALAAESAGLEASPRVRRELLAELSNRRVRSGWRRTAKWGFWPAVAAACLVAGFWIGTDRDDGIKPSTVVQTQPAISPAEVPVEPATEPVVESAPSPARGFRNTPVRSAQNGYEYAAVSPWYFHSGLPSPATARVVRTEVSQATAEQFGVYADGPQVAAEILVGDDGLARAIRFLRTVRRGPTVQTSLRQE
jgi:hypothetical protein